MLTVYYKNNRSIRQYFNWRVNGPLPPEIEFSQIECITVFGQELDIVYDNFTGIPFVEPPKDRHVRDSITWFGDHAKFIFANCRHLMINNKTYGR